MIAQESDRLVVNSKLYQLERCNYAQLGRLWFVEFYNETGLQNNCQVSAICINLKLQNLNDKLPNTQLHENFQIYSIFLFSLYAMYFLIAKFSKSTIANNENKWGTHLNLQCPPIDIFHPLSQADSPSLIPTPSRLTHV